jgi:hypothetical protein
MNKAASADRLKKRSTRMLLVWGIPFIILTSYVYLAFQPDLRLAVPEMLGVTAVVLIMLTIILYAGEQEKVGWSPGVILLMAFILRLLFLVRAPELSDDIYRYLWDGLQTVTGDNPYSFAPSRMKPHSEITAYLLRHMNHPDFVTIYPPFAQLIFAAGAALTHSLSGLKAVLGMLDLATCFMIIKILSSMNLPVWRASLYAWHPLPVLEIAGSGHIDGAGILFLFISIYILFLKRETDRKVSVPQCFERRLSQLLAGLAFSSAVLVKLIPLIYLPVLLIAITGAGSVLFIIGFLSGLTLLIFPFLPDLYNMTLTLSMYLHNWEFSNFAFRRLRDFYSSGNAARMVLLLICSIAISALSVSFLMKKRESRAGNTFSIFMQTIYGVSFSFLLLTPTLHPWYALYLAALFPFAAGVAGLILSWTVFLSYHVQIKYTLLGQWIENDLIAAVIWLAPVLAFVIWMIIRRLFRKQVTLTTR